MSGIPILLRLAPTLLGKARKKYRGIQALCEYVEGKTHSVVDSMTRSNQKVSILSQINRVARLRQP